MLEGQQFASANEGSRSNISDDDAEVIHLINTEDLETKIGDVQ